MRTTITLPDYVFQEVQRHVGRKSPSKTILAVLKDYLRRKKIRQWMALAGKVELTIDGAGLRELRDGR